MSSGWNLLSNLRGIFSFILLTVLFCSSITNAQSNIDKRIKEGLENCYNFRWNKAGNVFNAVIESYPGDPRGFHYLASTYLWLYLSNLKKIDYQLFIAYSDTALNKAKDELEENPGSSNLLYLIGADYSYRAIAYSKAEKFIDAAWAIKKSESYLSECLANDSSYYDAYLGLGLYNFAIGQISPTYKWALSLAGIKGDKIIGIKYIRLAAEKGNRSNVVAEYYLSQILTNYFNDYESASKYLKKLITKYPSNILFDYSYGVVKIKQRQLNKARSILKNILANPDSNFVQINSYSDLLMGDIFFKENNFDSAKVYYQNFINSTLTKDYTGIANYRLGISYEITGLRDTAIKYFKLAENGNSSIDDDIYAKRKGEYFSRHPLTGIAIKLIEYKNLIDNAKYAAAFDSLHALLPEINNVQLKAEANLRLSEAAYYTGQYQKSYNYAIAAKDSNGTDEKWITPYACFYAARAEKKLGNKKEVKALIDEAKSFSDYDYQDRLKNMLYAFELKS